MNRRLLTEQLPRLAGYRLAHEGLIKPPAPINLTLSVTNLCNSRCQTCDIWTIYPAEKERLAEELSLVDLEQIFTSIGPVYFFNISGGEPFLRQDIVDIVGLACRTLRPSVVHIPTNALLPERIEKRVEEMLWAIESNADQSTRLTVKPSFDGVGSFHDWIRGVEGNYDKLVDTIARLKRLQERHPRLGVGVGTVISALNLKRLDETISQAKAFQVDTYISEIAEERAEMRNYGSGITPSAQDYADAIRRFQQDTYQRLKQARGLDLLTQSIRHYYYYLTVEWLRRREQVLPCYAGISNAHISAYGDLWPCAILADSRSLGNLKDSGCDFWAVWHSRRADEVRSGIKAGQCDCPLANQAYANVLLSPRALLSVSRRIAQAKMDKAYAWLMSIGGSKRSRRATSSAGSES